MRNNKTQVMLLGGIIIIFYILPFVIFTQYTHLGIDDLCRTGSSFQNIFTEIISWYTHHNGRYINSVFSLLPVYDLHIYRGVLTISMFVFFLAIYFFTRQLSLLFGYSSKRESFIVSLVFIVLFLSELPSLYEIFYWYAGSTVYLYSSIFLLFLLINLFKVIRGEKVATITCGLLIVFVTGNTEMYIPLVGFILLIISLGYLVKEKKVSWRLLFLNILFAVSALIVFLAPGSAKRQSVFDGGGQLFFSLSKSVETALKITWNRFNEFTIWMFLLAILFVFLKIGGDKKIKRRVFNPVSLFLISAITFISVIFVPFFALGFLDYAAGRILDCIYFVFFILLLFNFLNLISFLQDHVKSGSFIFVKNLNFLAPFLVIIFLITVTISSQNYRGMYEDIANRSYIRFDDEITSQYALIKETDKEVVILPRVRGTKILTFDGRIIENECYLQYVRLTYNSEIKKIIVK